MNIKPSFRLFRRTGPFQLDFISHLYESFTFRGMTIGLWGIGVIHFKKNPKFPANLQGK